MRDIRSDLQDRANLLGEQINDAQAQFEELIQQYKQEHDSRVGDLKSELKAVHTLMGMEKRRLRAQCAPEAPLAAQQPQMAQGEELQAQHPQQQPQEPETQPQGEEQPRRQLAQFLVRRVREFGPKSKHDLCLLAMQEGYFADDESAESGVPATLRQVVEAGLLRQLPDGKFAPPTLLEKLRLAV